MRKPIDTAGFSAPLRHPLGNERYSAALADLVASIALTLATVITATVLTVGIARASAVDGVIGHEGSLFGIALLLGIAFIGIGGFAILPGPKNR